MGHCFENRLISERTVEENILKKAQQKKLLGDLAIEEGNFTTAFFKQNAIQDLFGENLKAAGSDLRDLVTIGEPLTVTPAAVATPPETPSAGPIVPEAVWEKAIEKVEDESDIVAAKTSKAEANAELAEFDESVPLDVEKGEPDAGVDEELDKMISEVSFLII